MSFVHLQLHTEYSVSDSLIRIANLIHRVQAAGMQAVAVTDHMALFAAVKFYTAALRQGIKPILGAELQTDQGILTVWCKNYEGYQSLSRLLSRAYREQQPGQSPCVQWDWLMADPGMATHWLAAATADPQGVLSCVQHNPGHASMWAERLQMLFPHSFYVEMRRFADVFENLSASEVRAEELLWQFADAHDFPVIATGAVRFLDPQDYEAHETRVAIAAGEKLTDPSRRSLYHTQQYFKTEAQMQSLWEDAPFVLENTAEIAKRCTMQWSLSQVFLPQCPIPVEWTSETFLRHSAEQGLLQRGVADDAIYQERLQHELSVILSMGFAGYFLIVADFIRWAKAQGIPVGPGRGSGAGSLVAYALGITDIDPLAYDLLFERFLNPERVSMPDFDIDFCMEGRDRVIQYVVDTYGKSSVSQIMAFGSMAAKAVIRDVGRVLDYPYGFVDKIAKLIPFQLGITLEKALVEEPLLRERFDAEENVKTLIELALKLEGLVRNPGRHAGGIVISPGALTDFMPLYYEPHNPIPLSQFDKDDVEKIGLIKFDFLGLKTLTIIDWAVKNIRQKTGTSLDITRIPLQDARTFALLQSGKTTGVFQLESDGMQDLIVRLQPDSFEDIIALVALYRPGPLQSGMVDDFIACKQGKQPIRYPHPQLEHILRPTYGVILYQEQVMQIAQTLAGYTLGQADLLRRAMGKKKPEEMVRQRAIFKAGAQTRGLDADLAESIFDLMEKFAGYGFNKSHSAAYALISYQTAYLKAHYPACFMAAVLSADMGNTDKIVHLCKTCKAMGLVISTPDVQKSEYPFSVDTDTRIVYGLGAIKGVSEVGIRQMVENRKRQGPFLSLWDWIGRLDLKKLNKRSIEALIVSGALDSLGKRSTLHAELENILQWGQKRARDDATGQMGLFGNLVGESSGNAWEAPVLKAHPPWSFHQRLQGEWRVLGHYISGHPMDPYRDYLEFERVPNVRQLHHMAQEKAIAVRSAGLIHSLRIKTTQSGDRVLFALLEDQTDSVDLAFFGETFEQYRNRILVGVAYRLEGRIRRQPHNQRVRFSVERLSPLDTQQVERVARLVLTCPVGFTEQWAADFKQLLLNFPPRVEAKSDTASYSDCEICLMLTVTHGTEEKPYLLQLGEAGKVCLNLDLVHALQNWFPEPSQWHWIYLPG